MKMNDKTQVIIDLEDIDWNFERYRLTGIYNIHWFPATFIPQIPSILIGNLSAPNSTVLDPFCGSGTTLVEAARLGRIGVGVDINPLAYLISKAKTTYISEETLMAVVEKYESWLGKSVLRNTLIPPFPDKERWFHKHTLKELGSINYLIAKEKNGRVRNLLSVCFSAILKKTCTQRDHYTYVADNMFPKNGSSLLYVDAKKTFLSHLKSTVNAINQFYNDMTIQEINPEKMLSRFKVLQDDARRLDHIDDNSVDLVVTSPPYANVTDISAGNRLSFYWLDLGSLDECKKEEIGARWKRFRKRAIEDYIDQLRSVFIQLKRVLKKRCYLCCILGETSSAKRKISLNKAVLDVLTEEMKFDLLSDSIRRNIYAKRIRAVRGVNQEHIYILRK